MLFENRVGIYDSNDIQLLLLQLCISEKQSRVSYLFVHVMY